MLKSQQQHRASLGNYVEIYIIKMLTLRGFHLRQAARLSAFVSSDLTLRNVDTHSSLKKMPHLPNAVGGAFFCAYRIRSVDDALTRAAKPAPAIADDTERAQEEEGRCQKTRWVRGSSDILKSTLVSTSQLRWAVWLKIKVSLG